MQEHPVIAKKRAEAIREAKEKSVRGCPDCIIGSYVTIYCDEHAETMIQFNDRIDVV